MRNGLMISIQPSRASSSGTNSTLSSDAFRQVARIGFPQAMLCQATISRSMSGFEGYGFRDAMAFAEGVDASGQIRVDGEKAGSSRFGAQRSSVSAVDIVMRCEPGVATLRRNISGVADIPELSSLHAEIRRECRNPEVNLESKVVPCSEMVEVEERLKVLGYCYQARGAEPGTNQWRRCSEN